MVNFFIISYVFSYQFSNHGMDRKLVEVDESILSLGKGQNRQNAELNINVPDNDIINRRKCSTSGKGRGVKTNPSTEAQEAGTDGSSELGF